MKHILRIGTSIFIVALSFTGSGAFAQQQPRLFGKTINAAKVNPENGKIRCATTEYNEYRREQNPSLESREEFEQWLSSKIETVSMQRNANTANTIITIPVVVHVIHNGDALGNNENITDAQVLSQIQVLNEDFRKMADTPGWNDNPVGADTEIQFALAVVDPFGQPTNGIDRVNLGVASWNESNVEGNLKPNTIWDPTQYFNIWVANFGGDLNGVLGYAQFPNTNSVPGIGTGNGGSTTDGVIIGYRYFGSENIAPNGNYEWPYNQGRTTTHEIGHALGLIHVSGDSSSCTVNTSDSQKDYCPDTPATNDYNYYCDFIDSCPVANGSDMIENYMDYTPDSCMNIFTQNQKTRMLGVLQNAPRRASLTTSTVWLSTPEVASLSSISIYPNPASNVLNISSPNSLPQSFVIYNSLGQLVANTIVSSDADLSINTSSYSNGVYFVKVSNGSQTKTLKFIKN